MKCCVKGCNLNGIDNHGFLRTTHSYCYEHRTCGNCGLKINNGCNCKTPKERINIKEKEYK